MAPAVEPELPEADPEPQRIEPQASPEERDPTPQRVAPRGDVDDRIETLSASEAELRHGGRAA